MSVYLQRTCTEAKVEGNRGLSKGIEDYREASAYVLLGDPGAGKTEVLKHEAIATGGEYISARDFLAFHPRKEWKEKVLFIDGLDETRAGEGDRRTALERIRSRLDEIGQPQFRLSCREADWLGASDREALARVSPTGAVLTLHLDPLTEQQILLFLEDKLGTGEAAAFIQAARAHGLDALLNNPQTLNLLVDALRGYQWPDSRASTYELACKQLTKEANREHRNAKRSRYVPTESVLDAAGYLSAVTLLVDNPEIQIEEAEPDHLSLAVIRGTNELPFDDALQTRLFKSAGGERFSLVHRTVAEFLAARWLAVLVEKRGTPLGRVLSLMTGADGGVVAGLRGLHAWLALHCATRRHELIENDPLGVVLYGDVRSFAPEDKRHVLECLKKKAIEYEGFRWEDWSASPFGALSTREMLPYFQVILRSQSRDPADQALIDCVVDAVRYGEILPELADPLLMIVRDATLWPKVRHGALRAFARVAAGNRQTELRKLADDVRSGEVEDAEDELLGILLEILYPVAITSKEIFRYLHQPKNENLIGHYFTFWVHRLPRVAPDTELPILLDALLESRPVLDSAKQKYLLRELVGKLLVRGLGAAGDMVPAERLYGWLGIGLDKYHHSFLNKEQAGQISEWFAARPNRYKEVLAHCEKACIGADDMGYRLSRCRAYLYGSEVPKDLAQWYLTRAESAPNERIGEAFFENAASMLFFGRDDCGLSLELLQEWVKGRPEYRSALDKLLYCEIPDWRLESARQHRESLDREAKNRREWNDDFRHHLAAIKEGSADPEVLRNLALAYFGRYYEAVGDSPRERLDSFLEHDQELVESALSGLKNCLQRNDLPTVAEIVELGTRGLVYTIGLPCLAGAQEIAKDNPKDILSLQDEMLARLVCFGITNVSSDERAWFRVLVKERPELVASVLVTYGTTMSEVSKRHVFGISSLSMDEDYAEVAAHAVLPLLNAIPPRARKLTEELEVLLKAGIRYLEKGKFVELIRHRLKDIHMDIRQHVYWIAAGFVMDPKEFEPIVFNCVKGSGPRRRYLAAFFRGETRMLGSAQIPATGLGALIRIFGPICSPERPEGAHWVSPTMETANLTQALISRLGGIPDNEAGVELERLLSDPELAAWRRALRHVREEQRVLRREASYRRPTLDQVRKTLDNCEPANAADLAALAADHLRELRHWIRHGNTDFYKQFWNIDSRGKAVDPRIEDSCRDLILDKLRDRLGVFKIDCQPEGHYADDKRADIRVSFGGSAGFHVPIEVKRDKHPDLWTAIHEQLIALYTRDPGAEGNGIYLVFWFGGKDVPAPPTGIKPKSAEELEQRLIELLTPQEQRLIRVCVLDVAAHR